MTRPHDLHSPEDGSEHRIPEYLFAPVRRWRLTLVCLALSALVAVGIAYRYGQKVWQVEGTIIYTPLSLGGGTSDYTPPSPQTLISLVKSPQRLQKVVDELQLPVPARTLERSLKANQQANVDAVRLSLEWSDPDVGRAIIDRLAEAYIRDTVELRRAKIQETLALLRAERETHIGHREEARAAYAKLPADMTRPRLLSESQRASAAATALTTELEQTTDKLGACSRKMTRARERVESEDQPTADDDTPYLTRKQGLQDAIRAQQDRVQEIDVEIESKKKEHANLEKLVTQGVGARLDYARVSGELDLLAVRRRSAVNAAEEHRKELAELPRRQARIDLARLEDEQAQLEYKAAALKRALDDNRREMVRLGDLSATEQAVAKRLEQAESGVSAVNNRIAGLERLRDGPVAEFSAAESATVIPQPRSNRKTLAALVMGVLSSITVLGLIGHARLVQPAPHRARTCGLPVLAAAHPDGASLPAAVRPATAEARRLALQLREPVRQSGGLVLFAPADPTTPTEDLVWQLARYLSMWGETVLILDARVHALPSPPEATNSGPGDAVPEEQPSVPVCGLSEYLEAPAPNAAPQIRKTGLPGVGYLPPGAGLPDADALASAAMYRLLVRTSEQYDRVLLIGPPLDQSLGAEILAGYADGAVVVFHQDGEESAECRRAAGAIRAAGVAWLGAVVRSDRRREGDDLPFALENLQPAGGRGAGLAAPGAERLPDKEPDVLSITWPQPARLGGNPPGPLESQALEQPRGTPHPADEHVEGGADLKAYRYP
jgi:Mrp family chromosome partitioning ATPase